MYVIKSYFDVIHEGCMLEAAWTFEAFIARNWVSLYTYRGRDLRFRSCVSGLEVKAFTNSLVHGAAVAMRALLICRVAVYVGSSFDSGIAAKPSLPLTYLVSPLSIKRTAELVPMC